MLSDGRRGSSYEKGSARPTSGTSGARSSRRSEAGRIWARRSPNSVSTRPGHDGRDRLGQDEEVVGERPVLDVEEVSAHVLVERDVAASSDLPEPRDPWGNLETALMPVLVLGDLAR